MRHGGGLAGRAQVWRWDDLRQEELGEGSLRVEIRGSPTPGRCHLETVLIQAGDLISASLGHGVSEREGDASGQLKDAGQAAACFSSLWGLWAPLPLAGIVQPMDSYHRGAGAEYFEPSSVYRPLPTALVLSWKVLPYGQA